MNFVACLLLRLDQLLSVEIDMPNRAKPLADFQSQSQSLANWHPNLVFDQGLLPTSSDRRARPVSRSGGLLFAAATSAWRPSDGFPVFKTVAIWPVICCYFAFDFACFSYFLILWIWGLHLRWITTNPKGWWFLAGLGGRLLLCSWRFGDFTLVY